MKLFITNGKKYLNTDEQVEFCDRLFKRLENKKNGHHYEFRFTNATLQLVDTYMGFETIHEMVSYPNTTMGEYLDYFNKKLEIEL